MKVFVSIDMEGITGVCVETQTDQGHSTYGRAAAFMRGDLDAVLVKVEQTGAACHEGFRSCFYRAAGPDGSLEVVEERLKSPEEIYKA